jgi:acetyl-CoA carboxylase biotin carboxylase subunit
VAALERVLVANRGEIAVRIIRACFDEGVEAVLAVSEADRESLGAQLADRTVCIGPAAASESYLDIDRLVAAAKLSGCDALHPGYGFVSERPELSEACAEAGIVFVGPSPEAMRRSGDKASARATAQELGIAVGEGSGIVTSQAELRRVADRIGYPILLKAAGGGGGRGMRRVDDAGELAGAWTAATAEARQAFGDERLFIERFVSHARHVEVQVLADAHGNVVHLGNRDCTLQRRHQKLIEEAPAWELDERLAQEILDAATRLIGSLDYQGAATCEFLVDRDRGDYLFLEINARLQVEHPVSEMVTGVDIVREQLRIAGGAPLSVAQTEIAVHGHAIEARINAESPERDFMPTPGRLERWAAPVGSDVRVDTACFPGWTVAPYYDSILAKVIARGSDRAEAIARLRHALAHLRVEGVATTTAFARDVLADPAVVEGRVHTRWIEDAFLPAWSAGQLAA